MKWLQDNRAVLVLGAAESISGIGDWITLMAVFALIVFRGDGTIVNSGGIFLAGLVPLLLFSPLAGWLSDRFDRRNLMVAAQLLSALTVVGLILARSLEWIYLLVALEAACGSLMMPARQAAIADLVARENLTRANAFLAQLAGVIKIGAPVFAGMLLAVVPPHTAMVLDVISFGLAILILSRLPALPPAARRRPGPRADTDERPAVKPQAVSPWTLLRESSRVSLLFAMGFSATFIIMGFDVLSSVFVRDVLGGGEELFGLMIGLIGIGTVVATGILMMLRGEQDPWRDALAGLVLLAVIPACLGLAAFSRNPLLARSLVITGCLIGGLGNGLVSVQAGTLLQLSSPPELLGRLGGLFQSTLVGGQLVSILLTPALIPSRLTMGTYFDLLAAALVALSLGSALALRRTRPSLAAERIEVKPPW